MRPTRLFLLAALAMASSAAHAQTATEAVRLGTPPNPAALLPGVTIAPIIGQNWDPVIDHSSFMPSAVMDILIIGVTPVNLSALPYGTLLLDPLEPWWTSAPGVPFSLPVPADPTIAGLPLSIQGASWDGTSPVTAPGALLLTNALDITLGGEPCDAAAQASCIALNLAPCTPGTDSAACGPFVEPCTPPVISACFAAGLYPCVVGTGSSECGGPCTCGQAEIISCLQGGEGACVFGGSCTCT